MNNKTSTTLLIAAFCMIIGITMTVSALTSKSPYMIIGWIFMIISIIIFGFVKTSKKKNKINESDPISTISARVDKLEKEVKELKDNQKGIKE
jgi:outer membrane murein-binding lipoprotein Lpp